MSLFPREDRGGPEDKLSRGDRFFLLGCVLIGAIALAVGFALYPKVNPEASIHFTLDRRAAEKEARGFLAGQGLKVAGDQHASRFAYDDEAKVYLERTLGLGKANVLMGGPVRMWRWGHRWFSPLRTEEYSVSVATTGQVVEFSHRIAEDAPGASLSQADARALAERFLAGPLRQAPDSLTFLEGSMEKRPARTDHVFTWKRPGVDLGQGDLRLQVRIQGDQVGGYREFVHVPEAWSRAYAELRSKNMTASVVASALMLLFLGAAVVVLFVRLRLRDIRWRTALIFGGIGTGLQVLAGLNALPLALFTYDTKASFSGYLINQLFSILRDGLLWGVGIFILTAAGETLYRRAYPEKISLGRFFSKPGLRTRRFLISSVLGLCLTCLFFCYQEVFYSVAQKLGAWAPMDVPYDDLLNTAFPWVFVLLIGFQPAVTEEFMSRMFSIPLLQKYGRSTLLAVVVPAVIWGFGHAGYPNQPFYIRGLEVGLVGILVGVVMLRVNILATLVWHFTVDALLTGYLLFRSGNVYYIVSAAAAGGLILLPTAYAALAYLRKGSFVSPAGLLNRDDSDSAPALVQEIAGERPAAEPASTAAASYPRWSSRRRSAVLLAGAASLLLLLIPGKDLDDCLRLPMSRAGAKERGLAWLRQRGEDPDSFRTAVYLRASAADTADEYLLKLGGVEPLRRELRRFSPPALWSLRLFRPLAPREATVGIEGEEGRIVSYRRHLAEADSVSSMGQDSAAVLAAGFIRGQGVPVDSLELKEASEAKRPHRSDYTFLWETRPGDPGDIGRARHRVKVVVQGNQIGAFERSLKLPEDWVRERYKKSAASSLRLILQILAGGAIVGLFLWLLVQQHRAGRIPWRKAFLWSLPFVPLLLLGSLNNWNLIAARYETSMPWSLFTVIMTVGVALGVIFFYFAVALSMALALSAWPEGLGLGRAQVRRRQLPDAALGALAGLAVLLSLRHLDTVWLKLFPHLVPVPSFPGLAAAGTAFPWFGIVFGVFRSFPMVLAAVAALLALLRDHRRRAGWTWLVLAVVAVAAVPLQARSGGEFLWGLGWAVARVAVYLLLARWFLAGNLLAAPLLIYLALAVQAVAPYLGLGGDSLPGAGAFAAGVLVLPLLWLGFSGRWRRGGGRGPPGALGGGGEAVGQRKTELGGATLLLVLSGLVLAPQIAGLGHGFYLDDLTWFFALFRGYGSFWKIFAPWKPNDIRCLGQLLFFTEYTLFGLHPLGYNIVSLLLHWGCLLLVGRLARLSGLSRRQSWAAALLFGAGLGHYTKPLTWACAQSLELATLFLLAAAAVVHSSSGTRSARRALLLPLLLFALALLAHEIVFLGFAGLAFLAYSRGERRWRLLGMLGLAEAAIYGWATFHAHTGHPVASGGMVQPLLNLFYFPAAYLMPVQIPGMLRHLLPGSLPLGVATALAAALGLLAGAAVLGFLTILARGASPGLRPLLVLSLLSFLPVLPMPMPRGWVEVRYLYPMSAFLAPVLVDGVGAAWGRLSSKARASLVACAILWGMGVYAGSLYMQRQAWDLSRLPATRRGWAQVQEAQPARGGAGSAGVGADSTKVP